MSGTLRVHLVRFAGCSLLLLLLLLPTASLPLTAQDATPSPLDQPGVTIHVVQRGETLYRIALNYDLPVDQIARVNGIGNPDNIQVGQRLLIPLASEPLILPSTTHTVQPGDTLQSIAQVYQVDEATLIRLNGITNPAMLYVGQVLTIVPESEVAPEAAIEPALTATPAAPEIIDPGQTDPGTDDPDGDQTAVTLTDDSRVLTTTGITHTVASGETLFRIATRYGISIGDLQAANNIGNASLIYAGQQLVIPGVEPAPNTVQLPAAIQTLSITPLTLTEGKTSKIELTTRSPATITATLRDQTFPVIAVADGGTSYLIWAVTPLGTVPGIYPFTLTLIEASGETTTFTFNVQVESGAYWRASVTLPQDKLELLAKPVEDNEINLLRSVVGVYTPDRYFDGPLSLPAAAAMNGPYGTLRSYNGGPFENYHIGADFAGAAGSPILAAAAGQVVLADDLNIRGGSVIINHGWGIYTNYSHMSQRYVVPGDYVQAGQVIGVVGSSGRATGAHLHWELWVNGVAVDPLQWVYQAFP